jgi:hypothetical protein
MRIEPTTWTLRDVFTYSDVKNVTRIDADNIVI